MKNYYKILTTSIVLASSLFLGLNAFAQTNTESFTGYYYDNTDFTNLKLTRTDNQINFNWDAGSPDPLITGTFSVRWEGNFTFEQGEYAFTSIILGLVKLYIDGELILDKESNWGTGKYEVYRNMTAGNHQVKMEYSQVYGAGTARLSWLKIETVTLPFAKGEHPRILITSADIPALVAKVDEPTDPLYIRYQEMKKGVDQVIANNQYQGYSFSGAAMALVHLIEKQLRPENSGVYLNAVKQALTTDAPFLNDQGTPSEWEIAYDWIYRDLTPEERIIFGNKLMTSPVFTTALHSGWHGLMARGFHWVVTGIAIWNETDLNGNADNSLAQNLLKKAKSFLVTEKIPYTNMIGAGLNPSYDQFHLRYFPLELYAWDKATNENLWGASKYLQDFSVYRIFASKMFDVISPLSWRPFGIMIPFGVPELVGLSEAQGPVIFAKKDPTGIAQHVANMLFNIGNTEIQNRIYRGASAWQYEYLWIIFYEPSKPATNYNTLPLAHYAQGYNADGTAPIYGLDAGFVSFRSGWTKDDTLIAFSSGDQFSVKQRTANVNAFSIYRKGDLVKRDDGNEFTGWAGWTGGISSDPDNRWVHHSNYAVTSAGANSISVSDPAIAMDQGQEVFWGASIGGVETVNSTYPYYYESGKSVQSGARSLDTDLSIHYKGSPYYDRGDIVKFETKNNYDYTVGDGSKAYHPDRLTNFQRALAFLDKKYLVVFDRVTATQPQFVKRWYLHTVREPQIPGTPLTNTSSTDGSTTWSQADFNNQYIDSDIAGVPGSGRLFVKSLLPQGVTLRKRGGEGFFFWRNDRSWNPDPGSLADRTDTFYEGRKGWRLEQDISGQNDDIFLNVLFPTDAAVTSMPETVRISQTDGNIPTANMVGAHIRDSAENKVILFSSDIKGTASTGSITYTVNLTANAKHFIFDLDSNLLSPALKYDITSASDGATQTITISPGSGNLSSGIVLLEHTDKGTLVFTSAFTALPLNHAPVLSAIGNKTANEGELLSFIVSASDPDHNLLTYSVIDAPSGASFNNSTGEFSWTPTYTQAGSYSLTFNVSDGNAGTASETIAITVSNVNIAPALSAIGNKTVSENSNLTFTISATDTDADPLIYSATNLPTGATLDSSTGEFSWTPTYTQAGSYSLTFSVADTNAGADSETITVTVGDVNRFPQISSGPMATPATINEDQIVQISVSAADPDGDNLTYQWQGTGGSITGSGANVTYNPPDVSSQTVYTINLTIADGQGGTITGSVEVNVLPVVAGTAHLVLGSAQGYPGDSILIPLNLSSTPSGKVVSAINLDLVYDAAALNVASVTIGQAAQDAQKTLSYTEPAAGRLRLIIFGLNQNTLSDGTIANLSFRILSSSSIGEKPLSLSDYTATDPEALSVPLTAASAAIRVLDHTPPTGTISVNNGAEWTNSQTVTLSLSASDESGVAEMRFSNDGVTYSPPEVYATTKSWSLNHGEGIRTVSVQFKDSLGNWNETPFTDTIILDTTIPVIHLTEPAQLTLLTNNPVLDISGEAEEDVSGIALVKINGNEASLSKRGKKNSFSSRLRLSEGLNTLSVEALDGAGNRAQIEILATLDTQPPSGAISINQGAKYTNSPEVILTLQAEEPESGLDIAQMQFSNDGRKFSELEDYATTKNWRLSQREGEKTVYVRFEDKAGNLSSSFKAEIILDQTAPRGSLLINSGSQWTNNPTVTLTLAARDSLSGVSQMRIKSGDKDSQEAPYVTTSNWTLSPGDGIKTVFVQFKDGAGNWSNDEAISSSVILDTLAPVQPSLREIKPPLINGYTNLSEVDLSGDKEQGSAIFINAQERTALNKSSSFNSKVNLKEGKNEIRITTKDAAGNESTPLDLEVKLKTGVDFTIISPNKEYLKSSDLILSNSHIVVLYTIDDESEIKTKKIKLREGSNDISLIAEDFLGNRGRYRLRLILDTTVPQINISSHRDSQNLSSHAISLEGKVKDFNSGVKSVKVNGQPAVLSGNGFSLKLNLSQGANTIFVEAEDNAGNSAVTSLVLNYTPASSPIPAAPVVLEITEAPITPTTSVTIEEKDESSSSSVPFIIRTYETPNKEVETPKKTPKEPEKPKVPEEKRIFTPSVDRETEQEVYSESYQEPRQPQVQISPKASPREIPKMTKAEEEKRLIAETQKRVSSSEKETLKENEPEKLNETIKIPVIKVKQMKRFLMRRLYKLELEGNLQPLSWRLAGKQKLPFGLRLDKNKGTISGIAWFKGKFDLKLEIITHDGEKLEVPCRLEIK